MNPSKARSRFVYSLPPRLPDNPVRRRPYRAKRVALRLFSKSSTRKMPLFRTCGGTGSVSFDDPYLATNSTFVYLENGTLHGIDATEEMAWEVHIERTPIDERGNDPPELQLIDEKSVAVVELGERAGEGLEESKFFRRVTVVNMQAGRKVG